MIRCALQGAGFEIGTFIPFSCSFGSIQVFSQDTKDWVQPLINQLKATSLGQHVFDIVQIGEFDYRELVWRVIWPCPPRKEFAPGFDWPKFLDGPDLDPEFRALLNPAP
jgi:hypothetical protein